MQSRIGRFRPIRVIAVTGKMLSDIGATHTTRSNPRISKEA